MDNIPAFFILKAFADNNFNGVQMMPFFFDRVENNEGNLGENSSCQHFLLSHNVFKRLISQACRKSPLCTKELTLFHGIPKSNQSAVSTVMVHQ